jgi:hypothetical protein
MHSNLPRLDGLDFQRKSLIEKYSCIVDIEILIHSVVADTYNRKLSELMPLTAGFSLPAEGLYQAGDIACRYGELDKVSAPGFDGEMLVGFCVCGGGKRHRQINI